MTKMTKMTTKVAFPAAALALLSCAAGVAAQSAGAPLLADPGWLADHLGDPELVILQVGPEELYAQEHVPGARRVTLDELTAPMPEDGRHDEHLILQLPEPEALRSSLQRLGIGDGSRIVVVPSGGWITPSARVLFTLDWAGLGDRTTFLDGGLEAWKAEGHPVSAEAAEASPGRLGPLTPSDRVVDVAWVREGWMSGEDHGRPGFTLLDARPGAFYDGVREDRGKRGHIPGAASLPWVSLYDETDDGIVTLKPVEEVRSLLADAGVEPGDTVVAYCHIGQYATAVLLAARVAGHDVRLFDGSMNQWALLDLPVEAAGGGQR
ncbi:MAG: rhodanese-like domain-containing protein [Gemmatimonadota bacterium]|jgi:thiosulfate/3-mercaptopyruvate sulfurtransferase